MPEKAEITGRLSLYNFILTMLVVYVHAFNLGFVAPPGIFWEESLPVLYKAENIISNQLAQLAVPGFFLCSGYLFFRKTKNRFDKKLLLLKWKRRLWSLLIPYLLWNGIYYLVYMAFGRARFGTAELFLALWNYQYNPVFWYMQELMLLVLLAPLIYALLRNERWSVLMLVLSFLLAKHYEALPFHLVNEDALLYYMTGAALGLHAWRELEGKGKQQEREKEELEEREKQQERETEQPEGRRKQAEEREKMPKAKEKPYKRKGFFACAGTLALSLFCLAFYFQGGISAVLGFRLFAPLALFLFVMYFGKERKRPDWMGISFFVYATHFLIIKGVNKAGALMFGEAMLPLFLLYLFMPFFCTVIAYGGALVLRGILPRLYSLLTGGR